MGERELIAIAAFRIREASRYLGMLALHAESPALRRWLLTTAEDLGGQAAGAASIVVAAEEGDRIAADDALLRLAADA